MLRKKIEAATGIAPSILGMSMFWEQLAADMTAWAQAVFAVETRPKIETRTMVSGEAARALFEDGFTFGFSRDASPGLCALGMDLHAAAMAGSVRLKQDPEGLKTGSSLFLKLLSEQPAGELWTRLAAHLPGHAAPPAGPPLADLSAATGRFEPASRYLQVGFRIMLDGAFAQVSLFLDPDYVRTLSRQAQAGPAKDSPAGRETLRERVRASPITLDAVLERITLTIGECSRLEVGQVLPLPGVDASSLALSSETLNGSVDIGQGELGVWKRQRALRLTQPVDESFVREVVDL